MAAGGMEKRCPRRWGAHRGGCSDSRLKQRLDHAFILSGMRRIGGVTESAAGCFSRGCIMPERQFDMQPTEWRRLEGLYHAALELDSAQRDDFLKEACPDDAHMRRRVMSLILTTAENSFIESAVGAAAHSVGQAAILAPGERLGAYEVVRMLGEGGMGCVYLATRADKEYTKQVAVKVVRTGGDDPGLLSRFRAERQILAHLDHPNIARLLDGGVTASGSPFVVMEFIGRRSHRRVRHHAAPVSGGAATALPDGLQRHQFRASKPGDSSRYQAEQHSGLGRWHGKAAGFRDCETAGWRHPGRDAAADESRHAHVHTRVCEPGAGAGRRRHHGYGRLLARRASLSVTNGVTGARPSDAERGGD